MRSILKIASFLLLHSASEEASTSAIKLSEAMNTDLDVYHHLMKQHQQSEKKKKSEGEHQASSEGHHKKHKKHKKKVKKHKKKHHKKAHHKKQNDSNNMQTENTDEKKEAAQIAQKAQQGLQDLENKDADIMDMLAFSKQIASDKTQSEQKKEQEEKRKAEEAMKKKLAEEKQKKEAEENAVYAEEEAEKNKVIAATTKKIMAQNYEKIMEQDDIREGGDGSRSNFAVLADQKAEQDYAVNVFKGSGATPELEQGALSQGSTQGELPQDPQELQAMMDQLKDQRQEIRLATPASVPEPTAAQLEEQQVYSDNENNLAFAAQLNQLYS